MSVTVRQQVHELIDHLDTRQVLSVRMFIEELQAARAPSLKPRPSGLRAKRISLDEYRREMGIAEPER